MQAKRPGFLTFLIVIYILALLSTLGRLVGFFQALDYKVLSYLDLGYYYFLFYGLKGGLEFLTLWFLFNPRPMGFYIALLSLLIPGAFLILESIVFVSSLPLLKKILVSSQEFQMFIRMDDPMANQLAKLLLQLMSNPWLLYLFYSIPLFFFCIWGIIFIRKRAWFWSRINS